MEKVQSCLRGQCTISALIIHNDGPTIAKNAQITINNTSFQEYEPGNKTSQPYKKEIDPKSKIEYSLEFRSTSPPQDMVIDWDDSRGHHSMHFSGQTWMNNLYTNLHNSCITQFVLA